MRFFRAQNAASYEAVRAEFDAIWGYPNAETKTETAITPAALAPTDSAARVYLIASEDECEYPAIVGRLPEMLSDGIVEEVSAAEFAAQFPSPF